MDDLSINKYRADFERIMRSKAEAWEFNPNTELEYWHMTEEEQAEHPLLGDFHSYVKLRTARLFYIFCAGAANEKMKQAQNDTHPDTVRLAYIAKEADSTLEELRDVIDEGITAKEKQLIK